MSVSCECCVLSSRGLFNRADHSSRGVLLSVACLSVMKELHRGGLRVLGLASREKKISILRSDKKIDVEVDKGTFSVGFPVLRQKHNKASYPQLPVSNFQCIFPFHTNEMKKCFMVTPSISSNKYITIQLMY